MTKPVTPIRKQNYELAKVGRRICEDCGANHPLDACHFYAQSGGRGFYYTCIQCWRFRDNQKFGERYHHDAEFRARTIARTAQSHARHRERHNATMRAYRARLTRKKPLAPLSVIDHRKRAAFLRIAASIRIERRVP